MTIEEIIKQIIEMAVAYAPSVVKAILALIIGFWVIGLIMKAFRKVLKRSELDQALSKFLTSLVSVGLKVMLLLAVAGMFGFETTSFIAILTAMAFAVGMALQGSLGNFASGVMILLFKPFKVGDAIEVSGTLGVVEEIQIFNSILTSLDNKKIIIPNSVVTSGIIKNITAYDTRRVDMTFGIGYTDDIDKAKQIISAAMSANDMILKDPAPDLFVAELADSSVNFVVRPWCKTEHYWDVYFHMHETLKKAFDSEGVNIPFPQMDVHVHQTN